jgi:hypothetical protein
MPKVFVIGDRSVASAAAAQLVAGGVEVVRGRSDMFDRGEPGQAEQTLIDSLKGCDEVVYAPTSPPPAPHPLTSNHKSAKGCKVVVFPPPPPPPPLSSSSLTATHPSTRRLTIYTQTQHTHTQVLAQLYSRRRS